MERQIERPTYLSEKELAEHHKNNREGMKRSRRSAKDRIQKLEREKGELWNENMRLRNENESLRNFIEKNLSLLNGQIISRSFRFWLLILI